MPCFSVSRPHSPPTAPRLPPLEAPHLTRRCSVADAPRDARDKLALLLSLIPYLMDHDRAPVADVATAFGVTPKQIREAVHLIAVAGVPGESRAYLADDLFDIDWDDLEQNDLISLTHTVAIDDTPRLSAREAA